MFRYGVVNEMPSDRLTARIPTTPEVHEELRDCVDGAGVETYDDYLRVVLGLPAGGQEKAQ